MRRKYNHLSYEERIIIRYSRKEGKSIREISRELSRAPSTISRELNRNEQFSDTRVIYPVFAQMKASGRRRRAYRKPRLKSKKIQRYVAAKIKLGWSPEQISGKMKLEEWQETVSHEAIYQYIYSKRKDLRVYLVRHHKRRKRFGQSKKFKNIPMPDRVSILERPNCVDSREEFGHWEVDLITSKQSKDCVQIIIERKSRLVKLNKLANREAATHRKAMIKSFSRSKRVCKTFTYDNGKENVEHMYVNELLGTDSYFCQPYHSWEKGSVENAAGLVRRKYPKMSDFSKVTLQALKRLERHLNHRPRKCLQYRTPMEVFKAESVALQC